MLMQPALREAGLLSVRFGATKVRNSGALGHMNEMLLTCNANRLSIGLLVIAGIVGTEPTPEPEGNSNTPASGPPTITGRYQLGKPLPLTRPGSPTQTASQM